MSGAHAEASTGVSADIIHAQAAQWILRRQESSDWSETDQAEVDAWFAQSLAHRVAYLRLEAAWTSAVRLAALSQTRVEPPAKAVLTRWPVRIGAVAAISGIVLLLGALASYYLFPREQTYTTPVGGHQTVALDDGSKIELNTDTVLRVVTRGGQRTAWLDKGEAYFSIHHNAVHPFAVMAAGHRVTDIGTEFLVRRDPDRFEVILVKGRAQVDTPGDPRSHRTMLAPGGVVVATSAGTTLTTKKSEKDLQGELGWRRGMLVFYRTTLAAAADEFNRYNREQLVIADPSVARLTINGTLPADNPQELTRIAQNFFGLHIFQRGDVVVISR